MCDGTYVRQAKSPTRAHHPKRSRRRTSFAVACLKSLVASSTSVTLGFRSSFLDSFRSMSRRRQSPPRDRVLLDQALLACVFELLHSHESVAMLHSARMCYSLPALPHVLPVLPSNVSICILHDVCFAFCMHPVDGQERKAGGREENSLEAACRLAGSRVQVSLAMLVVSRSWPSHGNAAHGVSLLC